MENSFSRKPVRLHNFDYSTETAYFITICTNDRKPILSEIVGDGAIAKYVGSLKRFTNKKLNFKLWQRTYFDHIIRDDYDYIMHLQYIEENPKKWLMGKDKYYA